jgi:hypothetical protein
MADGLNTVTVLESHLVELERVLAFAEGVLAAQDLERQYKEMAAVTRPSRLTQAVQRQLERVQGYLNTGEEDNAQREDHQGG